MNFVILCHLVRFSAFLVIFCFLLGCFCSMIGGIFVTFIVIFDWGKKTRISFQFKPTVACRK